MLLYDTCTNESPRKRLRAAAISKARGCARSPLPVRNQQRGTVLPTKITASGFVHRHKLINCNTTCRASVMQEEGGCSPFARTFKP